MNCELFLKSLVQPLIQPKLKQKIKHFPILFQVDFFFKKGQRQKNKK